MRAASILAVALFLAGCGTTVIDADKGEAFITKTVEEQTGARVESVACPDDLEAEKGATFKCTVTGEDGTTGEVSVDQEDDKGSVTIEAAPPFLRVRDLEDSIKSAISDQAGFDATVVCPEITEFKAGGTFECDSEAEGTSRKVLVTQKDGKGNVRFELE